MERLSRCYRYSIRTCKLHFAFLLQPFITLIQKFYQAAPHSSVLYLISICTDEFGSHQQYHTLLSSCLTEFSQRTFLILKDKQSVVENPDFTEDFFEMVNRYLKKCPQLVFASPTLPAMFQCGLLGLGIFHREAISAIMNFFGTLITFGVDNPKENTARGRKPSEEHVKVLNALFQQNGQQLITGLVAGISGGVPHSRIQYILNVVKAILGFFNKRAQPSFINALKSIPNKVPNELKEDFVRKLFQAPDFRAVKEAVYDYAEKCREYK